MRQFGTLEWRPALDNLNLVAPVVKDALIAWAQRDPQVSEQVLVAPVADSFADTVSMTQAYELPLAASVNCVLVAGKRSGEERIAAALVRATTRADVNRSIKKLLDVRKASFLATDRAVADSAMEYGGITPIGVPASWRLLLDSRVVEGDAIIGSGNRASKILLPGKLLAALPGAETVEGLAIDVEPAQG